MNLRIFLLVFVMIDRLSTVVMLLVNQLFLLKEIGNKKTRGGHSNETVNYVQ